MSVGANVVIASLIGQQRTDEISDAVHTAVVVALGSGLILLAAGQLIMRLAREHQVRILPVDSEHGAIFQCLYGVKDRKELAGLILTASGGPFRGYTKEQLQSVTKAQALRHPSWKMGAKITIDSATMVNKGLETIEARWLFDCGPDKIRVVVHPQSVIHSMIELVDGSVIAQLAVPDMRLPIEVALAYPERGPRVIQPLDLASYGSLTFEEPDEDVFVSLRLAREVMQAGGLYPAVLNAANECAVADFLADRIGFTEIYERIEKSLDWASAQGMQDGSYELAEVFEWEKRIRDLWSRNG